MDDNLFEDTPYQEPEMKDDLFEDVEYSEEPVSKLESGIRGAAQGASLGFIDELTAALGATAKDVGSVLTGEDTGAPKVTFDEEGRPIVPEGTGAEYEKQLEETRAAYKAAQEENPWTYGISEVAGGIIPGVATGGGAAAAKTGAALTKEAAKGAMKTAMKEGGKLGAKYGAVSGAGYSEGETPLEVATDVAIGAGTGALGGSVMPALAKGAKSAAKTGSDFAKSVASKIPGAETISSGYKYGKMGRALTQSNLDEDLAETAGTILKNIEAKKKTNDLKGLKQQLDDMGFKVNTKEAIEEAIDDLKKIQSKDFMNLNNKELLPKLERFAGINPSEEQVMERALKSKLKRQIETGSDETLTPLEIEGRPAVMSRAFDEDKIRATVGNIQKKLDVDLENMSLDEVDALRNQLNEVVGLAKMKGSVKDPVIGRAMKLAKRLKELSDEVVEGSGQTNLLDRRKTFSELFGAEDLLGIKGKLAATPDADEFAKVTKLAEALGQEGGIKKRRVAARAEELLGEDVIAPEMSEKLQLIRNLNTAVGQDSEGNISRSGLYKHAIGFLPNVAGQARAGVSKALSPASRASESVKRMTSQELGEFGSKLASSNNEGAKVFGNRILEAMNQEGPVKNQVLWSLSQSPAFRELVKRNANVGMEEEAEQLQEMFQDEVVEGSDVENLVMPASTGMLEPATLDRVKSALAQRESSNNPTVVNKLGYAGKYQFGAQALEDLGYLKPGAYKAYKNKALEMPEMWTQKSGANNLESFLGNEQLQDDIASEYLQRNYDLLKAKGVDVDNMAPEDVAGALMASHIAGAGGAKKFLSGEDSEDAFGTKTSEYYNLGREAAVTPEEAEDIEDTIDRVNQLQSSGDDTPMSQLDELLGKINRLQVSEEVKDELEQEATNMVGFRDGEILKEKLRRLQNME